METRTTKRPLVAGLLAAALLVAPAGLSAHAGPIGRSVEGPMRAISAPGSTGNSELDNLCRQAADLINNAVREQEAAMVAGDAAAATQWGQHASNMQNRAEGWGCQFVGSRQVPPGGPKQVPITESGPRQVSPPGSKPVPITNTGG
jgi:hypothetical protein